MPRAPRHDLVDRCYHSAGSTPCGGVGACRARMGLGASSGRMGAQPTPVQDSSTSHQGPSGSFSAHQGASGLVRPHQGSSGSMRVRRVHQGSSGSIIRSGGPEESFVSEVVGSLSD